MDLSAIIFPVLSLGGMALLLGLGLGFAGVKFKADEDERVQLIKSLLPGVNCGGCGLSGCATFAAAAAAGEVKPDGCPVGGAKTAEEIARVLGINAGASERLSALVKCRSGCAIS
ncbi:MAG: RnfABCDGE type electron transport complex subunit B, partial [Defluviitaleaceae bacterium]|nr:RnfABCDGE type electron transport complex subunit B [Defluviitaleaceae bacterium]